MYMELHRINFYSSQSCVRYQQTIRTSTCCVRLIVDNMQLRVTIVTYCFMCRSQWPRGERHELSSLSRKLGSWVRIPHKAWMFGVCMCLFCVCVFLCLGKGLATSWSLVQGVLPSVKMIMNWKRGQGPRGLWTQWKKKRTNLFSE
jgi:hypothetical protein